MNLSLFDLEKLTIEKKDPWRGCCKRCLCCEEEWIDCYNCEDGYSHHECGEDSCCCPDPKNNVKCDICNGNGGRFICIGNCNERGIHERN